MLIPSSRLICAALRGRRRSIVRNASHRKMIACRKSRPSFSLRYPNLGSSSLMARASLSVVGPAPSRQTSEWSAMSQRLRTDRHGGILPFNPATAVRGPKHVVKRGKTPVLAPEEARASVGRGLSRSRFLSLQRARAFSSGQSRRGVVMTQAKGDGEPGGSTVPLSTETFIFAEDGIIIGRAHV